MKNKTRSKIKIRPKMQEARDYVDSFNTIYGHPPTYREVQENFGFASVNTAYNRLRGYRHKMVKK